ncbi:hypothetical protein BpHYR1_008062 [Brachionus plicatilis]|uniref:Uncharacterized protein n=1 Tax=Brachionus plicatilis TaxID=10195 RepID=A0A3M7T398_BRAPC|nr:hypothetical protein BpHYR1_008062 [Brachionus plicatilis]
MGCGKSRCCQPKQECCIPVVPVNPCQQYGSPYGGVPMGVSPYGGAPMGGVSPYGGSPMSPFDKKKIEKRELLISPIHFVVKVNIAILGHDFQTYQIVTSFFYPKRLEIIKLNIK